MISPTECEQKILHLCLMEKEGYQLNCYLIVHTIDLIYNVILAVFETIITGYYQNLQTYHISTGKQTYLPRKFKYCDYFNVIKSQNIKGYFHFTFFCPVIVPLITRLLLIAPKGFFLKIKEIGRLLTLIRNRHQVKIQLE